MTSSQAGASLNRRRRTTGASHGPSAAAQASGLVLIATRAGGIPEVVEDGVTGLLSAPRDHTEMARQMVTLLGDEAGRRRMGQAGYARVKERFTVERMIAATAAVYERLTSASTRREAGTANHREPT